MATFRGVLKKLARVTRQSGYVLVRWFSSRGIMGWRYCARHRQPGVVCNGSVRKLRCGEGPPVIRQPGY
eukprot:1580910-Alexandrium_andersonii.AAC.1